MSWTSAIAIIVIFILFEKNKPEDSSAFYIFIIITIFNLRNKKNST